MKTIPFIIAFAVIILMFFHDVLIGPNLFLDTNPRIYEPWHTYASDDSPTGKTYFYDSFLTYLPRRVFLSENVRSGRLPLWNPYVFAGTPFLADPQARLLYPIELLLLSQDPERAMGYDIAIHVFLAMLGMYLFLRAIKVTRPGALLGGCVYAFSSFFYFRYGFPTLAASAAWIPFFFYGFEVARRSNRKGTLLLTGFFAMGYLAGFPQVFLFGVCAVVFYGFYASLSSSSGKRLRSVLLTGRIFGIAGLLSALLVSVQLVPFAELYRNSVGLKYPSEYVLTVFIAPAAVLLRSVFPGLFGNPLEGTDWSDLTRELTHPYKPDFAVYCGVGALILAIVSLSALRRSPRIRALLAILVLSIGVATSAYLLRIAYVLLPMFSASRVDRVSVLGCFALSAMAGVGYSLIARKGDTLRKYVTVVLIAAVGFALVSTVLFELAGDSVIATFAEKARAMPDDYWAENFSVTRSYRLRSWAGQDLAEWEAYEREQVRQGAIYIILSSAFLLTWVLLKPNRRNLRWIVGAAIILVIVTDVATTARTYYVSQTPGSIWKTEGIKMLKNALGEQGIWRTRTLRRTADEMAAFPCNANMLFDIQSVDGQSTLRPKGYTLLKRTRDLVEESDDVPLSARNRLAGELDDIMGVRFLIARTSDSRFEPAPVMRAIAVAADFPDRLGMLTLGGDRRLALRQETGESFSFDIRLPPAGTLDFAVGFDFAEAFPGDSICFALNLTGQSNAAIFRRGFDLDTDAGRWHEVSLDISKLRGPPARITASVTHSGMGAIGSVKAGWSRFEFPMRDCPIRPVSGGYEIDLGRRGRALSLKIRSTATEVPLDIIGDDGTTEHRWISMLPGSKARWITIDLKKRMATGARLMSDSTFSLVQCRQVWRGWAKDFACRLVSDTDMCIYENSGAIERGICIEKTGGPVGGDRLTRILDAQSLENIDDALCGTCEISSYQPDEVALDVSADRDCYVIFQDTWYPGWKAYVDGIETDISMTRLGLRVVEVPQGDHRIVMAFRPLSFRVGLLLTCLGSILTLVYGTRGRSK
jgi:hypothetical protein